MTVLIERTTCEGRETANQQYMIEQTIEKALRGGLSSQTPRRTTGPTSREK
jgi:hypothetical protein